MNDQVKLALWQKKQCAMLYRFASKAYLLKMAEVLNRVLSVSDKTLQLAELQRRDVALTDPRWGDRNTSGNWANHAWSFLADFQMRTAEDIALRDQEIFRETGSYNCYRGMSEYSTLWMTEEEEKRFDLLWQEMSQYARDIDLTACTTSSTSRWTDELFAVTWEYRMDEFKTLPGLQVRPDIQGASGEMPPRTGVYIPLDDPHGAPTFAWTGNPKGALKNSSTFNEIGLAALRFVGRRELWFNAERMWEFANQRQYRKLFADDLMFDGAPNIVAAPSRVGDQSFVSRPCRWVFVEMLEGEGEPYDDNTIPGVEVEFTRVEAGNPCPKAGYYVTPSQLYSRRYFNVGDIMPDVGNPAWPAIWQSTD